MSEKNTDIRIGVTTLFFTEQGEAAVATFTPERMELSDLSIRQQIRRLFAPVEGNKGPEAVKSAAELVFAAWFNKMNEIELADREKYEIVSEVIECKEYSPGKVKSCTIAFIFRERKEQEVKTPFSAN